MPRVCIRYALRFPIMDLNWFMFLPALLLVFFPMDAVLPKRLKFRDFDHLDFGEDSSCRSIEAWWLPSLWLDPLRAFAGAWLLRNAWVVEESLTGPGRHVPWVASALILAGALGVQMHTRRGQDMMFAPIGYVIGLWFGLLVAPVAGLAMVIGVGCVVAFRSWSAFFVFGAIGVGVIGYLIMRLNPWMLMAVALSVSPWFVSAMMQRTLIFPLRPVMPPQTFREVVKV